jgi:DegV family protein with EDD domain
MNSFPISVIDSRNASIGIGLIAIQVAEAVENGMQYDKLLNQVETAIRNTKVFVGLTTLEYVVRGGRVPASKKKIADLLHINPILSLSDSGIKAVGKSFGKKNILPKFKKFVGKFIDWNKPCRIGIAHANNEEVAHRWGEEFGKRIGNENVFISEIGPAIGVHSGPEGMVIAVQTLEEALHD